MIRQGFNRIIFTGICILFSLVIPKIVFADISLITIDRVNLREQASTDSAILQVLDPCTDITVISFHEGGWAKVIYNGQNGFIKDDFIGTMEQYTADMLQNQSAGINIGSAETNSGGGAELLGWDEVKELLTIGVNLKIQDVYSGKVYYVRSFSNGMHADVEPVTIHDTEIMKETYGGVWDWDARPVLVTVNDRTIAAAINGMPHAGGINEQNGMDGQICLHFKDSTVHNGNMNYNSELQNAVVIAYNRHK